MNNYKFSDFEMKMILDAVGFAAENFDDMVIPNIECGVDTEYTQIDLEEFYDSILYNMSNMTNNDEVEED